MLDQIGDIDMSEPSFETLLKSKKLHRQTSGTLALSADIKIIY